jgi:hypothetical protein
MDSDKSDRPFNKTDLTIILAALVLGLILILLILKFSSPYDPLWSKPAHFLDWLQWITAWLGASVPLLLALTISQVIIRLRPPRPSLPLCLHEPGFVACFSATTTAVVVAPVALQFADRSMTDWFATMLLLLQNVILTVAGITLAVSWLVLILRRDWRSNPHWTDRFGRSVGTLWIILSLFLCWIRPVGVFMSRL